MKNCSIGPGDKILGSDELHPFTTWESGGVTYSRSEAELLVLLPGRKLGNILAEWTKCPLECMNATCQDAVEMKIKVADTCPKIISIETCGVNPVMEPGTVFTRKIYICTLGIEDVEDCPLNK